jgi:hypothetical protein
MPEPDPDDYEQLMSIHQGLILELQDEIDTQTQLWNKISVLHEARSSLLQENIQLKQELHHLTNEFIAGRGALIVAETHVEQLTKEVELLQRLINPNPPKLEIITDGKEREHNRNS